MGKAVDDRSDIYSLGILLYEMLRGEVPFKAETLVGVAMKHVNDPMPDIQSSRPGTSSALAAVIERATQKDPKKRYSDMGAMLADLEGALEVEIARGGGATGEATTVLETVPSRSRILSSRSVSIVGILLVLAGVLVALALVELGGESDKPNSEVAGSETEAPSSGTKIELSNPVDFDPDGDDGEEHPDEVDLAIDGDPSTFWLTSTYQAGPALEASGKPGVGLIVEADEPVIARDIEVQTENPGWTAEIYAIEGEPPSDLSGWGEPISAQPLVANQEETTIPLNEKEADHFLIWITELTENTDDDQRLLRHDRRSLTLQLRALRGKRPSLRPIGGTHGRSSSRGNRVEGEARQGVTAALGKRAKALFQLAAHVELLLGAQLGNGGRHRPLKPGDERPQLIRRLVVPCDVDRLRLHRFEPRRLEERLNGLRIRHREHAGDAIAAERLHQTSLDHDAGRHRHPRILVRGPPRRAREPASISEHSPDFAQGLTRVGKQHQAKATQDPIDAVIGEIQVLCIEDPEVGVGDALISGGPLRSAHHLR